MTIPTQAHADCGQRLTLSLVLRKYRNRPERDDGAHWLLDSSSATRRVAGARIRTVCSPLSATEGRARSQAPEIHLHRAGLGYRFVDDRRQVSGAERHAVEQSEQQATFQWQIVQDREDFLARWRTSRRLRLPSSRPTRSCSKRSWPKRALHINRGVDIGHLHIAVRAADAGGGEHPLRWEGIADKVSRWRIRHSPAPRLVITARFVTWSIPTAANFACIAIVSWDLCKTRRTSCKRAPVGVAGTRSILAAGARLQLWVRLLRRLLGSVHEFRRAPS